jgi:hypothetical protein
MFRAGKSTIDTTVYVCSHSCWNRFLQGIKNQLNSFPFSTEKLKDATIAESILQASINMGLLEYLADNYKIHNPTPIFFIADLTVQRHHTSGLSDVKLFSIQTRGIIGQPIDLPLVNWTDKQSSSLEFFYEIRKFMQIKQAEASQNCGQYDRAATTFETYNNHELAREAIKQKKTMNVVVSTTDKLICQNCGVDYSNMKMRFVYCPLCGAQLK